MYTNKHRLLHPLALAVLLVSLALASVCAWLPPLRPWSWLAGWLLIWGLVSWLAIAAAPEAAGRLAAPRELRQLRAIRQALARRLAQQRAREAEGSSPVWTSVLTEALERLDDDVEPALRELLTRHESVSRHLRLYQAGRLPLPDQTIFARLTELELRQRTAIRESVQQASNAEGALLALLEERSDGDAPERARGWTDELVLLHDTLVNALGGDPNDESDEGPPERGDALNEASPFAPASVAEQRGTVPANGPEYCLDPDLAVVTSQVEDALRTLNNLSALAKSELIAVLPHTLSGVREKQCDTSCDATPLEQAQALHEALCVAIDRLKPLDGLNGADGVRALEHGIVFEEYVLRRSTRQIMVRHFVAEATFHRRRRAAIRAIASDLLAQEGQLARGHSNGHAMTLVGGRE